MMSMDILTNITNLNVTSSVCLFLDTTASINLVVSEDSAISHRTRIMLAHLQTESDTWHGVQDPKKRKQIQDRLAQRARSATMML